MSRALQTPHPSDEMLARFAAGDVDAPTREDVLAHVDHCAECMGAVMAANEFLQEEAEAVAPAPRRDSRWWMAIAAAVLLAILAVPFVRRERDPMRPLVTAAPVSARPIEPRLSGGFAWAPYHGPERSTGSGLDAEALKLGGAAGEVIDRAKHDDGKATQHAAGVALTLVAKPDDGAARLEPLAQSSGDAKTWSDLAAARYAASAQLGKPSLLPSALAAADAALRIDANLPEALFNRALILERMGRAADARQAWTQYLKVDDGSGWGAEARQHLNDLR